MNPNTKRIMSEEAAFSKGKQAYIDGQGKDDSPYSGDLRIAWEDGWDEMAASDKPEPIDLNL